MKIKNGKSKWYTDPVSKERSKCGYECAYDKHGWNRDAVTPET